MFFTASKILGAFVQPLNLVLLIAVLAGVFAIIGRKRLAKNTLFVVAIFIFLGGFTQIPDLALSMLERQSERPLLAVLQDKPLGVIILGGAASRNKQVKSDWYHLNDAAERITEGIILAKGDPSAVLYFTGGTGQLVGEDDNEALAFTFLFEQLDAVENEIILETQARNTWQNAAFTTALINHPEKFNWLLVTSAFHMPRAVACFRKAGLEVRAWPTDYRADVLEFPWLTSRSNSQFSKLNTLFHELVGLLIYKLTGRI